MEIHCIWTGIKCLNSFALSSMQTLTILPGEERVSDRVCLLLTATATDRRLLRVPVRRVNEAGAACPALTWTTCS
jgi:hypothetical protein